MNNINSRISQIISHFGLNKNSFSKKIGMENNVTIGNIVSGRRNKPSFDVIEKILLSFDSISSEWLIIGTGEMLKKNDIIKKKEECNKCKEKNREIEKLKAVNESLKDILVQQSQHVIKESVYKKKEV